MNESQFPTVCHECGGNVAPDPDPKRKGWLSCPTCGPVYMPLGERFVRVHIGCSLAEASQRAARIVVALMR